jgi:tetratricopeptide (TPR) repeat protein
MRYWCLFALAALGLVSGCEKKDSRRDALENADRQIKLGAYKNAVRSYESALDGTDGTADVHYKIAVVYDDKLKDPLAAIHHYERYLDFSPSGRYAKEAKTAQADCERRLQAKMSKEGFMTTAEAVRLRQEIDRLNRTIIELKTNKGPAAPRVAQPGATDKMPPGARTHTVQSGETLASIALKYYKSRAMSANIKDANFNQLGGKDIIHPGQVLIIPEAPKRRN